MNKHKKMGRFSTAMKNHMEGYRRGTKEREVELMDKMIELADKKDRWGKLWTYLKQVKEKK